MVSQKLDETRRESFKDAQIRKVKNFVKRFFPWVVVPVARFIHTAKFIIHPGGMKHIDIITSLSESATYAADGFATTHHVEFLNNDRFQF